MTTQCEATFRKFFATKFSFPKRFHCDLEGLYFRCCIILINTFWSRKTRTTVFFREKNRSACFIFCEGKNVKVNFAKVNFLKTDTARQHIQFAHRQQTILRVEILLHSASRFNVGSFFFRTSLLEALSWKELEAVEKVLRNLYQRGWVVGCKHLKNICNNISLL